MISRVRARLSRLRPPRAIRATGPGKAFLALTLALGAAAVNTGNNLLYIALSANLSLVILSGILSESALRRSRVRIRGVSEAFAGGPALLSVTLALDEGRKPARLPPVPLIVAFRFGESAGEARFDALRPGRAADRLVEVSAGRRGRRRPGSVTVSTVFPFGLFRKIAYVASPDESLIVYPDPAPERLRIDDAPRRAGDGAAAEAAGSGVDIRGIRDHAPTDPARDIHWKASARWGKWMVRERDGETAPVEEIRIPDDAQGAPFEAALSRACGAVLACERDGRPYRVWHGGAPRIDARTSGCRTSALSYLATARAAGEDAPPEGEDPR